MKLATLLLATFGAATVAHRLAELNAASVAMCAVIGAGMGIVLALLMRPEVRHG